MFRGLLLVRFTAMIPACICYSSTIYYSTLSMVAGCHGFLQPWLLATWGGEDGWLGFGVKYVKGMFG
jgi:hypothetical protein